MNFLKENGVATSIHYPIPPHKQAAFSEWNDLSFPITERIHRTCVSLPISPAQSLEDTARVVECVNAYNEV